MDISHLPDRLKRAGRNQAQLARFLQLDPSSLTKTIKGERTLTADELVKIETFFETEDDDLPIGILGTRRHNIEAQASALEQLAPKRGPQRRIPVYGYAQAGAMDSVAFNSGQVTDWIDPPPLWNGVGDLVAIRVLGDSMEPRLFAGELVVAQLGLPPARGGDCLIELQDGGALLKTYRGQRDATVFAHQYNPELEIKLPGAKVKAIHAVIWRR